MTIRTTGLLAWTIIMMMMVVVVVAEEEEEVVVDIIHTKMVAKSGFQQTCSASVLNGPKRSPIFVSRACSCAAPKTMALR